MVSTGTASHIFKLVSTIPGQKAKVYAHLQDTANTLYTYYRQYEDSWRASGDPDERIDKLKLTASAYGKHMNYEGGGYIQFGSAETSSGGRGDSLKYLQLSETAFWRKSGELRTGLLQSVPDVEDSIIIDESTANGVGGDFHSGWQAAMDPANKDGWLGIFCAWHEHPEYVRPLSIPKEQFANTLKEEERILCEVHKVSFEQLQWRRSTISIKCEGSLEKFKQEYPSTPEEAFLATGRTVFDMGAVIKQTPIREVPAGELYEDNQGMANRRSKTFSFVRSADNRGGLRVWKQPSPGHRYAIGADTAQGIDVNSRLGNPDPDYSFATVWDCNSGQLQASLRDRLTPFEFAAYLSDLGEWFNNAFICIESTGLGISTCEKIMEFNYPLESLYLRRSNPNEINSAPNLQEVGFHTNAATKPHLITGIQHWLRNGLIHIYDPIIIAELMTYVHSGAGKMGARPGCHDDGVISLGLGIVAIQSVLNRDAIKLQPRSIAPPKEAASSSHYLPPKSFRRRR